MRGTAITLALSLFLLTAARTSGQGAESRHFGFAYDQPHTTAYGIAADTFARKQQA